MLQLKSGESNMLGCKQITVFGKIYKDVACLNQADTPLLQDGGLGEVWYFSGLQ